MLVLPLPVTPVTNVCFDKSSFGIVILRFVWWFLYKKPNFKLSFSSRLSDTSEPKSIFFVTFIPGILLVGNAITEAMSFGLNKPEFAKVSSHFSIFTFFSFPTTSVILS